MQLHFFDLISPWIFHLSSITLSAALWYPNAVHERYGKNVPAKLEKNPFQFVYDQDKMYNGEWKHMENLMSLSSPDQYNSVASAAQRNGSNYRMKRHIRNYEYRSNKQSYGNTNGVSGHNSYVKKNHGRRYSSLSNMRYSSIGSGGGKKGIIGLSIILAGSILSSTTNASPWNNNIQNSFNSISNEKNTINFFNNEHEDVIDKSNVPELHHAHGTTTISFKIKDAIITAVDSRATLGNFVGSRTVQKVLPISKYIIGTMAGGELQYFLIYF